MPKQAYVKREFYSNTFSLLGSPGSVAVLDAISGRSLHARKAWLEIVSNTGIPATNPVLSLGNNASSYNNLMPNTTASVNSALSNDNQIIELLLGSINPADYTSAGGRRWKRLDIGSTGLFVNISTVASGGTVSALTGRIWVEGVLV